MKEPKTCDFCDRAADACVASFYWCDVCVRRFLRGDFVVPGILDAEYCVRERLRDMIRTSVQ